MPVPLGRMELGRELARAMGEVSEQIRVVNKKADEVGVSPHDLRDANGNYMLTPLIVAKAQLLHAIVLVNQEPKK